MKTVILSGPTASGKTALAIRLAKSSAVPFEIINADSLLFYRGMDIGTAKPTSEEREGIPHHLIDICNPDQPITAGDFVREAHSIIAEIHARGSNAMIVGGSGFYLKGLLYGLWEAPPASPALRAQLELLTNIELFEELRKTDDISALRIGQRDRYRLVRALEIFRITGKTPTQLQATERSEPDPQFELWVIEREAQELDDRIEKRTEGMIQNGWIEETKALLHDFPNARALQSVGYHQISCYLKGLSPEGRKLRPGLLGLQDEILLATRQLVKKQRTWFNGAKHKRIFKLPNEENLAFSEFKRVYSK